MTTQSLARGFFKGASAELVTVNGPSGDKLAFFLTINESDAAGAVEPHKFIVPPQEFQSLCAMLQEALTANGYAVPAPPIAGQRPQH